MATTSRTASRSSAGQAAATAAAAHRQSVQVDLSSIAEFLLENLGSGLVGLIAGVDPKTARRWTTGSGRQPREGSERRLRMAYQVFGELLPVEASTTIRAWFMGMNPQLGDQAPAEAIAQERYRDVLAAARSFVSGG